MPPSNDERSTKERMCVSDWTNLLGEERVWSEEETLKNRPYPGGHARRRIMATVFPHTTQEVVEVVRIASRHRVALYPISKGLNFGYGGASPVLEHCAVVDLSSMDAIEAIRADLGIISVQPGVAVGQVERYLEEKNIPFLPPTIGVGTEASLIGNVLEKGRSNSPIVDRMSSLVALEAVLADGSIYRTVEDTKRAFFKWGVGPYIDGLFIQSGFGIVTSATFSLAPKPESISGFYFGVQKDEDLSAIIDKLRNSQQVLGGVFSTFSIQSPSRVLYNNAPLQTSMRPNVFSELIGEWLVLGCLQGEQAMVKAAKKRIVRELDAHTVSFSFFNAKVLDMLLRFKSAHLLRVPFLRTTVLLAPKLRAFLRITSGKNHSFPTTGFQGGVSIVPVVLPFNGLEVQRFLSDGKEICSEHDCEFIMTAMNFTPQSMLCNLLFSYAPEDDAKKKRIADCAAAFEKAAASQGGFVYRASVDAPLEKVQQHNQAFWAVANRIKETLDPDRLISPGRYVK